MLAPSFKRLITIDYTWPIGPHVTALAGAWPCTARLVMALRDTAA
jgi:hypothetical protein